MQLLEFRPAARGRARSSVSRRTLQQRAISELGSFALHETELQPLMDKAARLVCSTLGTDFCKILKLLPNQKSLLLISGCGWKPGLVGKAIVGTGFNSQAGYTLRTGKLILVQDLRAESRFRGPQLLVDHQVTSGISAPIQGDTGTWGVLGTHSKKKKTFTPGEQEFFLCVIDILSAAIQRAAQSNTLAEVHENLQLALAIADVGTWRIDPETMLTIRDANLNRIYGLDPVDSRQPLNDLLTIVHPDDRARILQHFHRALESRQFTEIDFRVIRPNSGEIRHLHSRGKMLPTGFMSGATIDITERRRSEDLKAQLASIVESSQDAVISTTLEGIITNWNPGAEKLFGYTAHEMIGQSGMLLIPSDRRHEFEEVFGKLKVGIRSDPFETVRLRKDQTPIDVSVAISPLRNAIGEPIGGSGIIRDISRRKSIERALQQNETRLQVALGGRMGTWEWQLKSGKMIWSPSMEKIHGILPGSFSGSFEAFADQIFAEDREFVLGSVSNALEKNSNLEIEYRLVSGRWVEGRGSIVMDQFGNPDRMVGVCVDITPRKQSELSLRESEERFRNLADAAPVMIWMTGPDKQCTYFNKGWLSFRGLTTEQEVGDGWTKGVHPEDYIDCLSTFTEAFSERKPFQMTYRLRRHDSEYRHVLDSGLPRFASNGSFLGYVGTAIDISDLKSAERTIREEASIRASEERFRELADAMPHMVWEVRLDGSFDYFNKRWRNYTGITAPEGDEKTWEAITHPDDWPTSVERWNTAFRINTPCETECRFKNTATGEYRWHLSRSLPIRDKEGKVLRWIGTATDIEDQKRFQAELATAKEELSQRAGTLETAVEQRTRQLEESLKTTETLIYTIAHDLRAPLRAMQGLSMAVLEDYAFRLDDEGRDILDRINHSAMRMDKLISDLLAYGRLGYVELSFENLDLNAQVDLVLAGFADEIQQTKAQVLRAELPSIYANATVIRQILTNLIGNALKFVLPSSYPKVEIFAESSPGTVRLLIRDNGIGIDPHHRQRIFEVFQRLHTQEDYPGTGIGLAMVAKAAQRLGGMAGVESELGKGSTFWVELPTSAKT